MKLKDPRFYIYCVVLFCISLNIVVDDKGTETTPDGAMVTATSEKWRKQHLKVIIFLLIAKKENASNSRPYLLKVSSPYFK